MTVDPRLMVLAFPPTVLAYRFGLEELSEEVGYVDSYHDTADWFMHLSSGWTDRLFPIFSTFLQSQPPNIAGALAFLNSYFPHHIWAECAHSLVYKRISDSIMRTMQSNCNTMRVRIVSV